MGPSLLQATLDAEMAMSTLLLDSAHQCVLLEALEWQLTTSEGLWRPQFAKPAQELATNVFPLKDQPNANHVPRDTT